MWAHLLQSGACPWITAGIDEKLSRAPAKQRTRIMRPMLSLYYMAVAARKAHNNRRHDASKVARLEAKLASLE